MGLPLRLFRLVPQVCPPGCQALIDEMYINCDGVTTPDGLYYDPNNAIEGEWSDNVRPPPLSTTTKYLIYCLI